MDAVNPDYLAARILGGGLQNPVWILPTRGIPVLGNLYHGVQNLYVGLPIFKIFGFSVATLRVAQALFGAAIIGLLFFLVNRATGSAALSLLAALGLATDIAFQASFRTQNYIILGGEAWLFAALLLLYPGHEEERTSKRALFLSGATYGLSIYGYFVFLFFLPAIALLVWESGRQDRKAALLAWGRGFAVGMLPYVIGYLFMMMALGGVGGLVKFLREAGGNLSPFSSHLSLADGYVYALKIARLALENGGNEAMVLGESIPDKGWPSLRLLLIAAIMIPWLVMAWGRRPAELDSRERLNRWLVLLPCSYILAAGFLGQRLWAHHYSVLVALAYLLFAVSLGGLLARWRPLFKASRAYMFQHGTVAICLALFVAGNLVQQHGFYERLEQTGGVRRASNALTMLAEQARATDRRTVYLFPDWGFFMSFAFLTADRVPYLLEASLDRIKELRGKYDELYLPFWEAADREKYEQLLRQAGLEKIEVTTMPQLDGKTAFYLIKAKL